MLRVLDQGERARLQVKIDSLEENQTQENKETKTKENDEKKTEQNRESLE